MTLRLIAPVAALLPVCPDQAVLAGRGVATATLPLVIALLHEKRGYLMDEAEALAPEVERHSALAAEGLDRLQAIQRAVLEIDVALCLTGGAE